MKIAIYARVSTQQQNQTIDQQLVSLRTHIAQNPEWSLSEDHIYQDNGYSGANLNRPGLDRLRDAASMAEFETVWLSAPDRLARKYAHQIFLLESLQTLGVDVQFLERPINSEDPHDQLVLQMRGAVAEYERSLINWNKPPPLVGDSYRFDRALRSYFLTSNNGDLYERVSEFKSYEMGMQISCGIYSEISSSPDIWSDSEFSWRGIS